MLVLVLLFIITIFFLTKLILKIVPERCDSPVCLFGKIALVTGGASGIGYEIVLDLAKRGCKVIIADKNADENIVNIIKQETNNEQITMEYVDLASFTSIRKLAEKIKQAEEKLDILINNAGVLFGSNKLTEDGLNPVWQINYYSAFLLTHLLLDLLKKSQSSRIIFTSSGMSFFNTLAMTDFETNKSVDESTGIFLYSNTKCLNIVASDLFAEILSKYAITSNSYHPGIVGTLIFQRGSTYSRNWVDYLALWALYLSLFFFGKSTNEGAQTGIHLAVSKEVEGVSGKFFGRCSPSRKPKFATMKLCCEQIWKKSEDVVGLKTDERL